MEPQSDVTPVLFKQVDFAALGEEHPLLLPLFRILSGLLSTERINAYWIGFEILAMLLITYGIYVFRGSGTVGPWGYLRFTFPRRFLLHRSPWTDAAVLFINSVIFRSASLARILGGLGAGYALSRGLSSLFGERATLSAGSLEAAQIAFGVAVFLASDFGDFLGHYLSHRSRFLWEMHKVHHSAEVLTPLTAFREHPLLLLFLSTVTFCFVAATQGLFLFLFPGVVTSALIVSHGLLVFLLLETNFLLGHYPRSLSYGFFDRLIITPVVHRVHHSRSPRHFDKNFGGRITLWDWLFKTLYVPTAEEGRAIEVGLDGAEHLQTLNPLAFYWRPLVDGVRALGSSTRRAGQSQTRQEV